LFILGDIIDGKCKSQNDSLNSMNLVLNELKKIEENASLPTPLLHVWGNHEFYNFKRSEIIGLELNTALSLKQNYKKRGNYYYYDVVDFLRVICLDFYEFSVLGYESTDDVFLEASNYIGDLEKSKDNKYLKMNGAIKGEQLKWLEDQLNICKSQNKKVILCGHNPLLKEATLQKFLALNAHQILDLVWSYDNLILAYLSGHYHAGGYCRDKKGIHHVTLPGIIEKPAGTNSFMTVKVYENRIEFYLNNN
jgi:manganese-dependent ADP-ribose/CDP-alcohol diphosphatase